MRRIRHALEITRTNGERLIRAYKMKAKALDTVPHRAGVSATQGDTETMHRHLAGVCFLAILAMLLPMAASSPALAQCATVTGSVNGGCQVTAPSQVLTIESGGTLNGWVNMTNTAPGAAMIVEAGGTMQARHGVASLNGGGQVTNTIIGLAGTNQTLTNNGIIALNQNGTIDLIAANATGFTITNNGQITNNNLSGVSNAISINATNVSGTINNYGLITAAGGGSEGTIYSPQGGATSTLVINNFQGATIHSNSFIAVNVPSNKPTTLRNAGTISTGSLVAPAIQFGSGNDTLILEGTSAITGFVNGNGGTNNTFTLGGATNGSLDLSTIGAAAQYRNFQTFEKIEPSTWTLTGTSGQVTNWSITGGTLAVNGTVNGTVAVGSDGRLGGTGEVGSTTNAGTVAPGNSIGTLFINGDYTAAGGTLETEAVLSGTGSPADRLVVSGNVTGTTMIDVVNIGGSGAVTGTTNTDGISIVQVGGTSTADAFQLNGGYAAAGPYRYQLVSFDPASSAAGEADALIGAPFWDYRLQSLLDANGNPVPVPQIGAYQSMPTGALLYAGELMDSLHKRYDATAHCADHGTDVSDESCGYWFLRSKGLRGSVNGDEGSDYDQDIFFVQGGGTIGAWDVGDRARALRTGVALSYGGSKLKVKDTGATVELEGPSLAATATYEGESWYIDAVAQGTHLSTTVDTVERGFVGDPDGWGVGASVQGGIPLDLGNNLVIEPQAQLSYQRFWFDTFTDVDGIEVDLDGGESLRGRLGTRVQTSFAGDIAGKPVVWTPYVEASAVHEFLDGAGITAAGVTFATDNGGTRALFAGGLEADLASNSTLYAEVSREQGLSDGAADVWSGTIGLRLSF